MNELERDVINLEISEIEHLIKKFKEKFVAETTNPDDFMTISQLELMWSELQSKTNNIYSDMIRKMMNEVDESELIRKKKDITSSKG